MKFDKTFLGPCIVEYRNTASLILQTVIKTHLEREKGSGWKDFFDEFARENAKNITDGDNPYIKIIHCDFSEIDVTPARRAIVDLVDRKIINLTDEIDVIEDLRKCRNTLDHLAQTNKEKKAQEESGNKIRESWLAAGEALRCAVKTFGFSGEISDIVEKFADGSFLEDYDISDFNARYERANNDLVDGYNRDSAIEILIDLAKKNHIPSMVLLAKVCLNQLEYPHLFDPERAKNYAFDALELGNEGAKKLYNCANYFASLLKQSEKSGDANLKVIEALNDNRYVKVNRDFVLDRLLDAGNFGEDVADRIKKHIRENGIRQDAIDFLFEKEEFDFITEFYIENNIDKKEFLSLTRPCDSFSKNCLELLYIKKTGNYKDSELTDFLDAGEDIILSLMSDKITDEKYLSYLYDILLICEKVTEFEERVAFVKKAYDVAAYDKISELYESYVKEASEILPDSDDALKWYKVSEFLPESLQQKYADDFWQKKLKEVGMRSSSVGLEGIGRKAKMAGEYLKFSSSFKKEFEEKLSAALQEAKAEEAAERKRMEPILRERARQERIRAEEERKRNEILRAEREKREKAEAKERERLRIEKETQERKKHIEELEEIVGKKYDKRYWENLSLVEKEAKEILERKEKYTSVIGTKDMDFWRDKKAVLAKLSEIEERKEMYEKYIPDADEKTWQSEENIKEKLYPIFGKLTHKICAEKGLVSKYFDAYYTYQENRDIIGDKEWQSDGFFGNPDKYIPDEVNWEFFLNKSLVEKERLVYKLMTQRKDKFPDHSRDFWHKNYLKICETEDKQKKKNEKREKRNTTIRDFFETVYFMFFPELMRDFVFGAIVAGGAVLILELLLKPVVSFIMWKALGSALTQAGDIAPYIVGGVAYLIAYYLGYAFGVNRTVYEKDNFSISAVPIGVIVMYALIIAPLSSLLIKINSVLIFTEWILEFIILALIFAKLLERFEKIRYYKSAYRPNNYRRPRRF